MTDIPTNYLVPDNTGRVPQDYLHHPLYTTRHRAARPVSIIGVDLGHLDSDVSVVHHSVSKPAMIADPASGKLLPIPEPNSPTWPFVLAFAQKMEHKLSLNRHKGDRSGWVNQDPQALLTRVDEEVVELNAAVDMGGEADDVWFEAADVANVAMMSADAYNQGSKNFLNRELTKQMGNTPKSRIKCLHCNHLREDCVCGACSKGD